MNAHRFHVLGPLQVVRDGAPTGQSTVVPIPGGRQRAVLACLLMHAGQPVQPETLVAAGWGEDLPADPRGALHTVISRLRSTLRGVDLRSGPVGYTLQVPDEAVDARRFDLLVGAARAEAARAEDLYAEALALWHGPAYADVVDRDFAVGEAARLERMRLDATEELALTELDSQHFETAINRLEGLLAENPYRERAVELLMTALYGTGRPVEALALFRGHRARLADELGLDPMPALCLLEARILGQEPVPRRSPAVRIEVPAWLDTSTRFVGREAELADVLAAVAHNRVVTVAGTGGVGKSRLVAESLPLLVERFDLPIMVVELAPVLGGQVARAIADALKISMPNTREALVDCLSVTPMLLVLDNCEHLIGEVGDVVGLLVRRCPGTRVLTTSRHRLGLPSERVVPLAPLPVPSATARAQTGASPAVELFLDRAWRLQPGLDVVGQATQVVADICRSVDGLPLALELAAARTVVLGAPQVLSSLQESNVASLHGLEEVVLWSIRLLTGEQQRLLGQLSVFSGRFELSAVLSLTAQLSPWRGHGGKTPRVEALGELAESHLLTTESNDGRVSYRMLEVVRAVVDKHVVEPTERPALSLAHAMWARDVAEQAAHDWVSGSAVLARTSLEQSTPDLLAALRWSQHAGRLDVAAATTHATQLCQHWLPTQELSDLVVAVGWSCAATGDSRLARGTAAAAMRCAVIGDAPAARALADAVLTDSAVTPIDGFLACLGTALADFYTGDLVGSSTWLTRIEDLADLPIGHRVEPWVTAALVALYRGDLSTAQEWASAALSVAEATGAEAAQAFALYAMGEIDVRSDSERGMVRFAEAAEDADRIGAAQVSQVARLAGLAVLVRLSRYKEALAVAHPLLCDVHRMGSWPQVWTMLRLTAELLCGLQRWADAAVVFGAAAAAPGAPPLMGDDKERYAALSESIRRQLGTAVVDHIDAVGHGLPRAQIVDRILSVLAELQELNGLR